MVVIVFMIVSFKFLGRMAGGRWSLTRSGWVNKRITPMAIFVMANERDVGRGAGRSGL